MRRVIFLPALLLMLTACNHPFTADVATDPQIPGATRLTGKLYLSNSHLRIEWGLFTDVFDLNKRTGWRVITGTKTYWDLADKDLSTYAPEMTNGSLCPHAQVPSACKLAGQEDLEGRMANKWDLWNPKGFHVYFWTDKKLGITLLSEVGDATHRVTTYQVKNLRGGTVADTMFELPAGYTRYEGQWRP
ncbi:MAG TPA: hypothetical protein VK812_02570 [Candidatus Binatus sp.]|nr:hypothetical protein [Candidatus Binatus sp.]